MSHQHESFSDMSVFRRESEAALVAAHGAGLKALYSSISVQRPLTQIYTQIHTARACVCVTHCAQNTFCDAEHSLHFITDCVYSSGFVHSCVV